jgi:hypothetical protein
LDNRLAPIPIFGQHCIITAALASNLTSYENMNKHVLDQYMAASHRWLASNNKNGGSFITCAIHYVRVTGVVLVRQNLQLGCGFDAPVPRPGIYPRKHTAALARLHARQWASLSLDHSVSFGDGILFFN